MFPAYTAQIISHFISVTSRKLNDIRHMEISLGAAEEQYSLSGPLFSPFLLWW